MAFDEEALVRYTPDDAPVHVYRSGARDVLVVIPAGACVHVRNASMPVARCGCGHEAAAHRLHGVGACWACGCAEFVGVPKGQEEWR